jgi:hypothetical protein
VRQEFRISKSLLDAGKGGNRAEFTETLFLKSGSEMKWDSKKYYYFLQ